MHMCMYCTSVATFFREGILVVRKWLFFKKNIIKIFRACPNLSCQYHAEEDARNWAKGEVPKLAWKGEVK